MVALTQSCSAHTRLCSVRVHTLTT